MQEEDQDLRTEIGLRQQIVALETELTYSRMIIRVLTAVSVGKDAAIMELAKADHEMSDVIFRELTTRDSQGNPILGDV